MAEATPAGERARTFFEGLWSKGDHWELDRSEFERNKYTRQMSLLGDRRYKRVLEIGCGGGNFTRMLADAADHVLAVDVAPSAITRSERTLVGRSNIELRLANVMEMNLPAEGPWDLLVISETIYYMGWLYSFSDVAWLARELFAATRENGRLLMANSQCGPEEPLMMPWIIRTYRDLFLNVGFAMEHEEMFRGTKRRVPMEVLISVFCRDRGSLSAAQA